MSTEKSSSFARVEELMPQISVEQAARYYGVTLPELKRVGSETRTACFLNCGKTKETGDRAIAIQCDDPLKKWHCHQYGCGKGGNLVGLCDLMKPGQNAGGGPVRGQRFKEIRDDLLAMTGGQAVSQSQSPPMQAQPVPPPPALKVNVPLKDSDNERVRAVLNLDQKFVVDIADMSPAASAYFRKRPYLTPEVCKSWRLGYLPRDVGGKDKSGGTMRGKITYAYPNETGDVLTWFGRDPEHEAKKEKWEKSDRKDPEPEKVHFVKGFHRGSELYGVHAIQGEVAEKLRAIGCLPLVEGPNDVIRMSLLDVPAVALCSNRITREQAAKVAALARDLVPGGVVGILLDVDEPGLDGARQCLGYISQVGPVRMLWTDRMFGGKFKGRQPENLTPEDWGEIKAYLLTGKSEGWSLS
jgi:hypothetical protein